MNTAEILRCAAARVRQGWCQGTADDGNGGVCAVGAIWHVMGSDAGRGEPPIRLFIARALRLSTPDWDPVPLWNDAPGQTAENVAHGLEFAAVIWEQDQALSAAAARRNAVSA